MIFHKKDVKFSSFTLRQVKQFSYIFHLVEGEKIERDDENLITVIESDDSSKDFDWNISDNCQPFRLEKLVNSFKDKRDILSALGEAADCN